MLTKVFLRNKGPEKEKDRSDKASASVDVEVDQVVASIISLDSFRVDVGDVDVVIDDAGDDPALRNQI